MVEAAEWRDLSAGIVQRAELMEAILADCYGEGRLVADGLLPAAIVAGIMAARALAPLADLRPAVAEKLTDTLRSWLLHHGRREDVAAALFVHPQTVRYRMGQLREIFGDGLDDPDTVLELTIALSA